MATKPLSQRLRIPRCFPFIGDCCLAAITDYGTLPRPPSMFNQTYIENRGESSQMVLWVVNLKHHIDGATSCPQKGTCWVPLVLFDIGLW